MGCRMKLARKGIVAAAALALGCLGSVAAFANVTYLVDLTVTGGGKTGTVVGSITTDGALGTLATSDIVAWNLTLNGYGAAYTISNTDPTAFIQVVGSDVTATATDLSFDFGGSTGNLLFQDGMLLGTHYFCAETGGGACFLGESVVPIYYGDTSSVYSDPVPTGSVIIGTAVPEPSTWALMLAGFAGLALVGYRRSRKVSLAPSRA
jgi:hypothetical protein